MAARRKRTSRALIGFLIVTIVLGAVFYTHNVSTSRAADKTATMPAPVAPVAIASAAAASAAAASAVAPAVAAAQAPARPQFAQVDPTTRPKGAASSAVAAAPSAASAAPVISGDPIAEAKAKLDAGKPIAARKILNDALGTGSPERDRALRQMIGEINQAVVFTPKSYPDDPWAITYTVKPGETLGKIANNNGITWELIKRVNNISDPKKVNAGRTLKVLRGPVHAVVSKRDFTLDLYFGAPGGAGSTYITTYRVGLGENDSTPTGTWKVKKDNKLKNPDYYSPRGEGIIHSDDPKNPLGEFWIGLEGIEGDAIDKKSYGIHGTIEPDSIGKMESMGCIRLVNEDVERVFEMLTEVNSTVVVRD